jgi:hypothetical protein
MQGKPSGLNFWDNWRRVAATAVTACLPCAKSLSPFMSSGYFKKKQFHVGLQSARWDSNGGGSGAPSRSRISDGQPELPGVFLSNHSRSSLRIKPLRVSPSLSPFGQLPWRFDRRDKG